VTQFIEQGGIDELDRLKPVDLEAKIIPIRPEATGDERLMIRCNCCSHLYPERYAVNGLMWYHDEARQHLIERSLACTECFTLLEWVEVCHSDGTPKGCIVGKKQWNKDPKAINDWLEKHGTPEGRPEPGQIPYLDDFAV